VRSAFPSHTLLPLTVVLSAIAVFGVSCGRGPSAPTNLLLISIDTLRPDMLGCYGYDRPTSPTLDRLASEGVLFEFAVASSPWTLPSHASMLTGVYANRHAMKSPGSQLPDEIPTIAEILSERGFATGAFVNSHYLSKRYGLGRGFDAFRYVREATATAEPARVGEEALAHLAKNRGEPFFLFVHLYDVHSNYISLPEFEERFIRPYDGVVDGTTKQLIRFRKEEVEIDDDDRRHLVDLYVAGIRQIDDGIDRLLSGIEELDLLDRTLVIVTADHGEEFLEHGGFLHGRTQYDELLRIPLIIHGPGVPRGKRIAEPVSVIDLLPTALSLFGAPADPSLDGLDISPLWRDGAAPSEDRPLFSEADHNNEENDIIRSVRYGGYKLVRNRLTGEEFLFDLRRDPGETTSLIDEEPEIARRLGGAIDAFDQAEAAGVPLSDLSPEERALLEELGYIR